MYIVYVVVSVFRVQSFDKPVDEIKTNNVGKSKEASRKTIRSYLMQESSSASSIEAPKHEWKAKDLLSDRSSSPEAELYMDKLNMMNQDFDNLMFGRLPRVADNNMDHYRSNYTPSSSSTELMAMSSDREDSGIHTADVSCSVSQADEQFEDSDIPSNTIPNCIEKLNQENVKSDSNEVDRQSCDLSYSSIPEEKCEEENCPYKGNDKDINEYTKQSEADKLFNKEYIVNATEQFLFDAKNDSTQNKKNPYKPPVKENPKTPTQVNQPIVETKPSFNTGYENVQLNNLVPKPQNLVKEPLRIYENVIIMPEPKLVYENIDFMSNDILAPPKMKEPPKVKPPPPPPVDISETDSPPVTTEPAMKRLNSTKRIKKEIQIKRSSFLGLEEPVSLVDPDLTIEKPPDVDLFLKQESRLEKSFYKKLQGSREGGLSEVDSQDSGLEVDRGRLSSDTWCSSFPDSGTPIHHGRQDSEVGIIYKYEKNSLNFNIEYLLF